MLAITVLTEHMTSITIGTGMGRLREVIGNNVALFLCSCFFM